MYNHECMKCYETFTDEADYRIHKFEIDCQSSVALTTKPLILRVQQFKVSNEVKQHQTDRTEVPAACFDHSNTSDKYLYRTARKSISKRKIPVNIENHVKRVVIRKEEIFSSQEVPTKKNQPHRYHMQNNNLYQNLSQGRDIRTPKLTKSNNLKKEGSFKNKTSDGKIIANKSLTCNKCKKGFKQKSQLNIHDKNCRPFECDECKKCFTCLRNLNVHKKCHIKPFECYACEKCFSYKDGLIKHMRIHTGEKPFVCDVCEKGFTQKTHLVAHERIHTGEKPFQCDVCEKCFTWKRELLYHRKCHTGDKPSKCDNYIFKKTYLQIKKMKALEKRSFECDVCKKCFAEKMVLTIHKRIHTGEKPFQCDFCEKDFTQKTHLIAHERIHTGERPFECDVCYKCFAWKRNLLAHRKIHTGEKPFECDECGKCFMFKKLLLQHKKIHTR